MSRKGIIAQAAVARETHLDEAVLVGLAVDPMNVSGPMPDELASTG